MVTADDVRAFASTLPRAYEALVRDQVKFQVSESVKEQFAVVPGLIATEVRRTNVATNVNTGTTSTRILTGGGTIVGGGK